MNPQQLSIRLYGEPVGILQQGQMGEMLFQYLSQSKSAISIGMPIREAPYEGLPCEAFFGGLLPESETVRKILGKHFHVSPHNSFALLRAIGYDCAGAISCHQMDEPLLTQQAFPLSGKFVSDDLLYQYIKALPQKPLFMDLEGLRLSLTGIQDKAAICLIDSRIALPLHGCPTTHILKPSSLHYEGLAVNEYFCMKVAKRIGLPVPEVELRQIKDCIFLLIARYDRRIQEDFITRIHQEDFCQALIRLTSRKYQSEGGPGFKDLFDLLKITSQPAIDRNHLATALVFNYLLGNMDAHGKNFSLLHQAPGIIKLAPFYDLVCTRIYPNLTAKMAMKIGSKYDAEKIFPRHWEQLCNEINYRYLAMEKLIKSLGLKLIDAVDKEKEEIKQKGVYDPIVDKISAFVEANVQQVMNRFG